MSSLSIEFRLKELMIEKNISIRRLSILSGVSRTYIGMLIENKATNPTLNIIVALAVALQVSVTDLIGF